MQTTPPRFSGHFAFYAPSGKSSDQFRKKLHQVFTEDGPWMGEPVSGEIVTMFISKEVSKTGSIASSPSRNGKGIYYGVISRPELDAKLQALARQEGVEMNYAEKPFASMTSEQTVNQLLLGLSDYVANRSASPFDGLLPMDSVTSLLSSTPKRQC